MGTALTAVCFATVRSVLLHGSWMSKWFGYDVLIIIMCISCVDAAAGAAAAAAPGGGWEMV